MMMTKPYLSVLLLSFLSSALAEPVNVAVPSQADARLKYRTAISSSLTRDKLQVQTNTPPAPPKAKVSVADSRTVYIGDIRFVGNERFDDATLHALCAPHLKKNLNFAQIMSLAGITEKYYNDQGYPVVKVFVPRGGLTNGVLTVEVLEGKLGDVKIEGNKRYSVKTIQDVMDAYLQRGKIFKLSEAEAPLVLLNSYPGLEVSTSLAAGATHSTTDLTVRVKEQKMLTGSLELNNFGSETAGQYRVIPHVALLNPSGFGDRASFFGVMALDEMDTWTYQFDYSIPVTSKGGFLSAYFGQGNNTAGNEFEVLDINGTSFTLGFGYTQQLIFSAKMKISLQAMFDAQNTDQTMLGLKTIDDSVRKLRLGATMERSDLKGRTYLSFFLHQGLGEFLGGMENDYELSSRAYSGADGEFTKLVFSAMRVQSIDARTFGIFNFTAQTSFDPLVSTEQIYIGGANSLRGQPYSMDYGDSGIILNAELRYSPLEKKEKLQLAAFFDYACTQTKEPLMGKEEWTHAAGAGVGIRSELYKGLDCRLDVAVPVGEKYGDSAYVYGQLRYSF